MIVPCRRPSCDQLTRTAFREIRPYCSPECAQAHTQAHRVTVSLSRRPMSPSELAEFEAALERALAEPLRATVELPPYGEPVGFDEPAPRGWLGRALDRLKPQEGSK